MFGGSGTCATTSQTTPIANTGVGGCGGGSLASTRMKGGSGAGGGGVDLMVMNPLPSYPYSVGAGGALGAAGTNGAAGVAGSAGVIYVWEYYD